MMLSLQAHFLERVQNNPYPGRALILGVAENGLWLQMYWIMGRSDNSRNRIFEAEGGVLRTQAADPAKMQDPSLVIYEAMLEQNGLYLVSNGDQTRTVYQSLLARSDGFESGLLSRDREPDAPNFTPRITGMIDARSGQPFFRFAILKANADLPSLTDRNFFYKEHIAPGKGYMLSTYEKDGNPLPSFSGEPVAMPLMGAPEDLMEKYWASLNPDNKIALALKVIDPTTGRSSIRVKNRFCKKC